MLSKHKDVKYIDGVRKINIHQVSTNGKGNLQFFESTRDIPFEIKRIYFITDVDSGIWRGGHAHKHLKQLVFCPYGHVHIELTDTKDKCSVELDKPDIGVLIEKPIWRDMYWEIDNSVLCVAASDYYLVEDYIRDYSEFKNFMEEMQ